MKKYDYNPDASAPRTGGRIEPLDMLSVFVLLITACLGVYFTLIFINPASALNPLPPSNPFATPTYTITPIQLEATWTASPTVEPTITETPRPTFTPLSSPTFFSLVPPTETPVPTATPKADYSGSEPKYIDSTVIHPDKGCNFLGVGGTVVDVDNADIPGKVIVLLGTFNGKTITSQVISGISPALGRSGFEFPELSTVPVDTRGTLYVQMFSLDGQPISDKIFINTYADCSKNLVIVRFKANRRLP
jgi:hypothetical protein